MKTRKRKPIIDRFFSKVERAGRDDCWHWKAALDEHGYGRFRMPTRHIPAHRFSFLLAYGYVENDKVVMHSCDNPPCVNPFHLSLGTKKENMQDCALKGRAKNGGTAQFKHPRCKFTPADVVRIKRDLENGRPIRAIARETGLERKSIQKIDRNQWEIPSHG